MNRLDQQAEQDLARADVRDEARAAEFADRANGSPEPSIPAAKPEARAKILRFIPASEFLKPPTPPNWIVDGIAETDSFCVLFGDPESGKSFMAMDWACCVATGTPWKDRKVKKGPVLYINGEGQHGVNRLLTARAIANGVALRPHPPHLYRPPPPPTAQANRPQKT